MLPCPFYTTVSTLWTASLAQPSVGTTLYLIAPGMGAYITVSSTVGCRYLPTHWKGLTSLLASWSTYTYRLVDVVREYGYALVRGLTALMVTLAPDPVGRELFEYWHYEGLHSGRPAAVEDLFDAPWQDGPSFYALQGSEALRVAEEHDSGSMMCSYNLVSNCCNLVFKLHLL